MAEKLKSTGTREQYEIVSKLAGPDRGPTRDFLVYLLGRCEGRLPLRLGEPSNWSHELVYMNHREIDALFRRGDDRPDYGALRDAGVEKKRYVTGVSPYGFGISDRVLGWYIDAGRVRTAGGPPTWVDLYTGRPTTARVKSRRWTESRNPLPALVRGAIDAVAVGRFDAAAVEAHLDRLGAAYRTATADRARAWLRLTNDERCYRALFTQGARPVGSGVWEYRPAYRMQSSGRIGQIGGGLQNASRAMKSAAYGTLPGVRNYDLRSSQPRILIVLMGEAGLPADWLRRYADDPDAKRASAAATGLSVDGWKRCLNSLLMGARAPTLKQAKTGKFDRNALVRTVRDETEGHAEFDHVYGRLRDHVGPLVDDLREWHRYLVGPYVERNGVAVGANDAVYVENRVGAVLEVDGPDVDRENWLTKAKMAAHLLQGREAAFTHTVAMAGASSGYTVLAHEHDGLVVEGRVPEDVVVAAADEAGLPAGLVDFEEKAFL